jgi:hypothetical protein
MTVNMIATSPRRKTSTKRVIVGVLPESFIRLFVAMFVLGSDLLIRAFDLAAFGLRFFRLFCGDPVGIAEGLFERSCGK